jgi:hypothetical protein
MNDYLPPAGTIRNGDDNVVPFRPRRVRHPQAARGRVIFFAARASDLKQAVMNAYLDRLIDAHDVADVFAEYGLRHD